MFFATGAGAGYLPYAPGTFGTVVAIPLSLALNRVAGLWPSIALCLLVAFIVMAAWLCQKAEQTFSKKDCQKIVLDEIAGFLVANLFAPAELKSTAVAFVLFRFFDIMKVLPGSWAETLRGGVILDDLIAGFYTFVVLHLLMYWSLI